jgi:N-methylhydantoinase B
VMFSFFGGGLGGSPESDGLNHGNAPISTATIPPLEILEAAYPVMFTRWALRGDSGGPGAHRGGLGAVYEIELLEEQADVFLFGERGKFAPPGVVGGQPATKNRQRDPEAVARDVRFGFVSREAAQREYGVAVRADGALDVPATTALRQKAAE